MKLDKTSTPEDVRAEWVRRLREDNLPQTMKVLTEVDEDGQVVGNCCLGVLMEMAVEAGVAQIAGLWPANEDRPNCRAYEGAAGLSEVSTLTVPVSEWAGLPTSNPDVRPPKGTDPTLTQRRWVGAAPVISLAELNDAGVGFPVIAGLIESEMTGT